MALSIQGYIVEKPRVGSANSPFTSSPDNLVANSSPYQGADEESPGRAEYLVLCLVDGDLPDAEFGWTRNDVLQRFDYEGINQRFRPLPGGPRLNAGTITANANTTRLIVPPPQAGAGPYRLAVGSIASGTTFTVSLVDLDSDFGAPGPGSVELSLETGALNWNTTDISATYVGQDVFFQRQGFFAFSESTGEIGIAGDVALLNPIPATGQKPLVRFGFGLGFTPVERATEAAFSADPVQGTFEWALSTGRLKFNTLDLLANVGEPVYYDGVLFALGLALARQSLGTVSSPSAISSVPPVGGDIIFRAAKAGGPTGSATFISTSVLFNAGGNFVVNKVKAGDIVVLTSGVYAGARRVIGNVMATTLSLSPPLPSVVAANYRIERKADIHQFSETVRVETLSATGKADVVQVDESGDVQFSSSDEASYGTRAAEAVLCDLLLERGVSFRFFRSPVDLNSTNPDVKDVSAFFSVLDATLADPIIATPSVMLPTLPIDSVTYPTTIEVVQGTGTFTGELPRLDSSNPPVGIGYVIDFDARQLTFAVRREDEIVQVLERVAAVSLPDPLLIESNAIFALNQGSGYVTLTLGEDAFLDAASGVLTFVAQNGTVIVEGASGFVQIGSLGVFRDTSQSLSAASIGDLLVVPTGPLEGVYTIISVTTNALGVDPPFAAAATGVQYQVRRGEEVLADRFFEPVVLADPNTIIERIRSSTPTVLAQGKDFRITPELGLIQLTERLLSDDELRITYASTTNPSLVYVERGTFLVRKEVTTHPTPTSTISFNPTGKTVAEVPAPSVFRGGRPQSSNQVMVSALDSTISFLPDVLPTPGGALKVTDALPHGPIVNSNETVYLDYYVYEAFGGENTITVLHPPIDLARVDITDGETSFKVRGNWVSTFPVNYLLRIETDYVHYVTGSSYNGSSNETTVTVGSEFRDSFRDPKLYLTSGVIRLTSTPSQPAYFVLESAFYDAVPRGMNVVKVEGDRASLYQTGTVIYFSDGTTNEFYSVTGAKYDAESDRTLVTFAVPAARQYALSAYTLRRSVRPIFESSTTSMRTLEAPLVVSPATTLVDSILVFRQVEGQPGIILSSPEDYTIDDSGKIELKEPLAPGEKVSVLYTRYRYVSPGSVRASYTAVVAPTATNGLLNQVLKGTYTTYLPDSFYTRVETMTNFRAEVAEEYKDEALSSAPSGGPRTENAASTKLYEQGAPSLYFTEGRLANEDIIARATLKFYNDSLNFLEDLLRNIDGRIVGDYDGKLRFDGTTGSVVSSFSNADNQIDDRVKISELPIDKTPPLFPLKFLGTYVRAYEASTSSRFYPTYRNRFNYTIAGSDTDAKTGDPVLDLMVTNVTGSSPTAIRRLPRAMVTRTARAGETVLYVDTTDQVDTDPYRPPFDNGMLVVVQGRTGTFYVTQGSALEIASLTGTSITLTDPLPVDVPIGATVYLADSDTEYNKAYRIGNDLTIDTDKGYLLYVKPYPPYDGSSGDVPAELEIQPPESEELLQAGVYFANRSTSPDRFPALDGKPLDDDGDQRLPLINPTPARELGAPGYLETELTYIGTGGVFDTATVDPYIGTANLNGAGTVLTLTSGTFPAPAPQVGDLVRILSGANGTTSFRRVTATTSSSVTTDVPFSVAPDTGVSFLVTVAANLVTGTFTVIAGAVVTDLLVNFVTAGVKKGQTVVITQVGHPSYLQRRQVASVTTTQITLTAAFTSSTVPVTYRVHNPLNTFSNISDLPSVPDDLVDILELDSDSEVESIDNFYAAMLTDIVSSTSGTVNGTTLTRAGGSFFDDGVLAGDLVYVTPTQSNEGFYIVEEVTSSTSLTVESAFPVATSVTFRVVSSFGVAAQSLNDLTDLRKNTTAFSTSTLTWSSLVEAQVPVLVAPSTPDATYFAMGYVPADFTSRTALINARKAYLATTIPKIEAILSSVDKLYDKRFVWIDARINLEKGLLVKQRRAVEDRIKTQADTLKQLTKLLAVES